LSRTAARETSMKLLFEINYKMDEAEQILSSFLKENELDLNDGQYITEIVTGTLNNIQKIDELIEKYSRGWKVSRLAKIDLIILRLSIFELQFTNTPDGVVINEAVELAKKYGTDKSGAFINGLLANIIKE
jgi:transcription antitermination protein NusB